MLALSKRLLPAVVGMMLCLSWGCRHGAKQPVQAAPGDSVPAALLALNQRILSDSGNADLYEIRARYYLENGKPDKGLTDISKAIQLKPSKGAFLLTLSDVYLALGNPDKCNDALLRLMAQEPENKEVYQKLAELNLYKKDYDKSLAYTDKILEIDAVSPQAYFIKGFVYKEKGDTSKALKSFRMAVDQKQDFFDAYMQLGLLMAARHNAMAEDYYRNALRIKPKSPEALYALGVFYQQTEDFDKAIITYNDLAKADARNKNAPFNLGFIHLVNLKVYSEAVKYFSEAINRDQGFFQAYYNRGYAFELMGDVLNAQKDYQKALQLKPDYQMAVEGLNRLDRGDKMVHPPSGR